MKGYRKRAWSVLCRAAERWQEDEGFLLSAAMAYYAAVSFFPLVVVVLSLLGFVLQSSPDAQGVREQFLQFVDDTTGSWLAQRLALLLDHVEQQAALASVVGFTMLLVAAIGVFSQFDALLHRIWLGHGENLAGRRGGILAKIRRALRERWMAFLILLGIGAAILLLMAVEFALTLVRGWLGTFPAHGAIWSVGQYCVSLALTGTVFAVAYKTLPPARIRWTAALVGGFFVALVWKFGQAALLHILIVDSYTAYGVVGSFLAVLLWIYYASGVVFFGAELVRALGTRDSGRQPDE